MSVRTQGGGQPLSVKKARTANPAKRDTPRAPRTVKKTAPAPSAKTAPQADRPSDSKSGGTADNTDDDLDKITAGMKKIKINLITKTQKEARERDTERKSTTPPAADEKPTLSESNVFAVPALPGKAGAREQTPGDISPTRILPSVSTPTQLHSFSAMTPDPQRVPLPNSSPVQPTPTPTMIKNESADPLPSTPDVFVPYQPEGPEPVALPQQEPLKWLPPNGGTPTPTPMKRGELPVFTATSAIPFAPSMVRKLGVLPNGMTNAQGHGAVKAEPKTETSVWDVPETPQE